MAVLRQQDTVAHLAGRLERLRAEARALEGMPESEFNASPPSGGWSVGQVVEHLAVSNEDYLPLLRELIARGRALPAKGADATWKPRLVSGFLWRSLEKENNRLPAPAKIRPHPMPPPDALARYEATLADCAALLPETQLLPWNSLVGRSPLSALVRPNLGDVLMTIVTHCERHHRQIARLTRRGERSAISDQG